MIDNQSIENLKQRLDIVDVVSNYLELKKNGANFKAVCPFHDDSNPSLVLSPTKQIYHCFSCGAGGDPIRFVMEYEKLSYPEAIEKLASMVNFTLSYTGGDGKRQEDKKLLENLNLFYTKNLAHKPEALEYIKQRGIGEASIEKFELGYAPSSAESLNFLSSHGYSIAEAMDTGVAGMGQNDRAYARFIERITFPIYTANDKIVGFGGRTIIDHPAKYVNSPQTRYFNKSTLLYGYNFAKESIYKQKQIIVTEGYLDVIMLHQAGFQTAVATLGTALTKEHLPLLSRGNPSVVLAYDGDEAGVNAALKASSMLSQLGMEGGVILFTENMDPADMVQKGQIERLNKMFNSPQPFIEFTIERIIKKYDIKNPLQKQKALEEGSSFLKTLAPSIAQSYIGILSGALHVDQNMIKIHTKSRPNRPQQREFKDYLELTVIKTLLSKPTFIDTVLDTIDLSMFKTHHEELSLLFQNEKDHPKLRTVLLDDGIKTFEEEDMIQSMVNFLKIFYRNERDRVKQSKKIDYNKKSFALRKIQHKLTILDKGQLVPYEPIF